MISSSTLTYSRYPQRSPLMQSSRSFQMPVAESETVESTKKPSVRPLARIGGYDQSMPTTATDKQMHHLVDRLNHRLNPDSKELSFKMDANGRHPRIVLMAGNQEQGSYSRDEVPVLESYLHEMAGMHLSVVT